MRPYLTTALLFIISTTRTLITMLTEKLWRQIANFSYRACMMKRYMLYLLNRRLAVVKNQWGKQKPVTICWLLAERVTVVSYSSDPAHLQLPLSTISPIYNNLLPSEMQKIRTRKVFIAGVRFVHHHPMRQVIPWIAALNQWKAPIIA